MKKIVFYSIKNIRSVFCNSINEILKTRVMFLHSKMGRGKTEVVNNIINLLGGKKNKVNSPSYKLKNIYKTNYFYILHYDLHNINSISEVFFKKEKKNKKKNIIIFEWGETIEKNIAKRYIKMNINLCKNSNTREILLSIK